MPLDIIVIPYTQHLQTEIITFIPQITPFLLLFPPVNTKNSCPFTQGRNLGVILDSFFSEL